MRKVELFFRGEFWLHLATMFFAMSVLLRILDIAKIKAPFVLLLVISIAVGFAWEIVWKIYRKKPIDLYDIMGTAIGGILAMIF